MSGRLRVSLKTEAMDVQSEWTGLTNPELDPAHVEGGEAGIRDHPSTRMRQRLTGDVDDAVETSHDFDENDDDDARFERGWAKVKLDPREWGKVLSVGRMGGRVIACTNRLPSDAFIRNANV